MGKITAFATLLLTTWASSSLAEDAALIINQDNYRYLDDVAGIPELSTLEDRIKGEGFTLSVADNDRSFAAWQAVEDFRQDAEDAKRVLIYLSGTFVTNGSETWLLTQSATEVNDLNVGSMGVPMSAILASAAAHPERALVMLAPEGAESELGAGLSGGISELDVPIGVSVLIGPARGLNRFIDRIALVPETEMRSKLANNFPRVEAFGHFADSTPFTKLDVSREEREEDALNLTRAQRRDIQRDLSLLGYKLGAIDGQLGRRSREAISDWQANAGYDATGYLNARQIDVLQNEAYAHAKKQEEEAKSKRQAEIKADNAYWKEHGQSGDARGLLLYLKRYPDGLHAKEANNALRAWESKTASGVSAKEQAAWKRAARVNSVKSYRGYLASYPKGKYANLAGKRIEDIRKAQEREAARKANLAKEKTVVPTPDARRLVERRLTALGFDAGPTEGTFNTQTRRAIRAFQKSRGMPVTGFVDNLTLARLMFLP